MQPHNRKYCVIGAGFSGLAAAAALQRHQIPYDQLEADEQLGGNWYHGVYPTAHIISSRKTTEYADYPMPRDYPDFPSAEQMLRYLHAYADVKGLRPHLELNARVERVAPDADESWAVTLASGERRRYAGVIVCNGHHWDQRWPDYPGSFTGEVLHSKQYKGPEVLRGKRVLVVGGGNSACDIAVEAARFAEASHISLRRGYWFMPKTLAGVPTVEYLRPWMSPWLQERFTRIALRLTVGKYSRYGLEEPDHPVFSRHPTVNSQLLYFLKHGKITPHRDIARLEGSAVRFEEGERRAFDLLIYATGYKVSIPFVDPDVVRWSNGFPDLIHGVFSARHRGFYVLGLGQPRYGAGPVLSAAADALARCIAVEPELRYPVGRVLQALGQGPLRTYLLDPHGTIRGARLLSRLARWLPRLERWLVRGPAAPASPRSCRDAERHRDAEAA